MKTRFWIIVGIYILLVLALGFARLAIVPADENGSTLTIIPIIIILVAATVGPACMAEMVFSKYQTVRPIIKRVKALRRRIKVSVTDRNAAAARRFELEQAQTAHRKNYAQLKCLYDMAYRNAGGKIPEPTQKVLDQPPDVPPIPAAARTPAAVTAPDDTIPIPFHIPDLATAGNGGSPAEDGHGHPS